MWRSLSSPSSGACASATSARGAPRAASQARGAQIPPRPTPPSRSMATQDQGQCASPWSPRTLLTGLTPTSL
uniref:Alternative protein RELA n=1 Tax=Homo sapiens TaxID=9606 RepID=L0R6N5_HUMAN|nr:alternative protein RELA [Homo sapiens]